MGMEGTLKKKYIVAGDNVKTVKSWKKKINC